MKNLTQLIDSLKGASLEERSESEEVIIETESFTFRLTIPKAVNELFWTVEKDKEKFHEDWNDYYGRPVDELREEKKLDCLSIVELVSQTKDFRVFEKGIILKTKVLECLVGGDWVEFWEQLTGEPARVGNG